MFVNAQLPTRFERAGEYPSGGPHPYFLQVWRAAAPSLDFFSPDIYWPDFEYWVDRYNEHGNPVFIPEARLDVGPYNAFYAYWRGARVWVCAVCGGQHFRSGDSAARQSYAVLQAVGGHPAKAQREGRTRGLVLHVSSPRATQTVSLVGTFSPRRSRVPGRQGHCFRTTAP